MKFICGPEWDERVLNLNPRKKIGVLVSSGMDSTTLLWMLSKHFPYTEIQLFNIRTGVNTCKPVIEHLLNEMNLDLKINVVGDENWKIPMYNHHARLWLGFDEIRREWDVDELYCGNLQSPREEFFRRFDIRSPEFPVRHWLTVDPFLKNPLEHLEKYHVVDLGRREGIEHIHDMTISCNRYELWNCGECMGCDELKWAKQMLESPPTTTLDTLVERALVDINTDTRKNRDKEFWNAK